ncbi:MAG: anthranilate phosphoribosyltransferase [Victivallaceae bacterium]
MLNEIIEKVVMKNNLSIAEMTSIMDALMDGMLTPAQTGALLVALRMKGETVEEVTGAALSMRRHATFIDTGASSVIDTCGTGGDKAHTFNISTAVAFVAAGAGIVVAKHGNRSVSSKCGSADVLAAAGFNLDVDPLQMEQSIRENGIGFLFAPKMHPAMKNVVPIRRELKMRTIFNMLGPLTNPAGATGQVLGVFSPVLTEMFAAVLKELGTKRAIVVHGRDGLDEITCTDASRITELRDGEIKTYELFPEILIGQTFSPESIRGDDAETNARIMREVLSGRNQDGARAVVLLNAAAAIVVGEKADTMQDGLKLATQSIDSGAALEKLEKLIEASHQ